MRVKTQKIKNIKRVTPDYLSQSLTVSVKTEAMLMQIEEKYYFIEYPTNKIPNPSDMFKKDNIINEVGNIRFIILKECFESYLELKQYSNFLHAPSFIYGWCYSKGFDLKLNGILN